jgi:hypothetical protein
MDDEYDEIDEFEADIESNSELNEVQKKQYIFWYRVIGVAGILLFISMLCIGVTLMYIYSH